MSSNLLTFVLQLLWQVIRIHVLVTLKVRAIHLIAVDTSKKLNKNVTKEKGRISLQPSNSCSDISSITLAWLKKNIPPGNTANLAELCRITVTHKVKQTFPTISRHSKQLRTLAKECQSLLWLCASAPCLSFSSALALKSHQNTNLTKAYSIERKSEEQVDCGSCTVVFQ